MYIYPLKTTGWNLKTQWTWPCWNETSWPKLSKPQRLNAPLPNQAVFFCQILGLAVQKTSPMSFAIRATETHQIPKFSHEYFNPGRCWVISLSYCHSLSSQEFPLKSLNLFQPIFSWQTLALNESQTSYSCASMCSIWSHLSQQYTQSSPLSLRRWTHCLLLPSAKMPWRCCFETRYRGHEPANHRSWLKSWGCFVGVEARPGQSNRIATKNPTYIIPYPEIYPKVKRSHDK